MSVVRAILGRFARFLVRLARRLDPALATIDWVMPGRMAALRLRYPGAPDHWLRLAARYPSFADRLPHDPAPRAEVEQNPFPADQSDRRPEPALAKENPDHAPPRPGGIKPARPIVAVPPARAVGKTPPAAGTRLRPRLNFAPARKRETIVRLLTSDRPNMPRPILRFLAGEQSPRPDPYRQADQPEPARQAQRIDFPSLDERAGGRPEWPSTPDADREPATVEPHWPAHYRSPPAAPSRLDRGWRAERRETRFSLSDNRWPELPSLPDEASPQILSARDEAALIAEQIGGTWSA